MKRISTILTLMVAVLAFWGCKEDTYPRLEKDPATLKFTINTPPMANQYLYLSDGNDATFDLSCSQPDYGFSAIANYVVMVSLSEEFSHNAKFEHDGEDKYFPRKGDYVELRDPGTLAKMQVKQLYLTRAICKLLTYNDANGKECQIEDAAGLQAAMTQHYPNGYMPVYIKIRCYVPQDEEASNVISENSTCLTKVVPSFSLEAPSVIYMTGGFNGWPTPGPAAVPTPDMAGYPQCAGTLWAFSELVTEIDSKIFRASLYLTPTSDQAFRFYQIPPASGWGATGSLGGAEPDFSSVDLKLAEGKADGSIVTNGQGNWTLMNEDGSELVAGWYDFDVDLNNMTITVSKVSEPSYPTTYNPN